MIVCSASPRPVSRQDDKRFLSTWNMPNLPCLPCSLPQEKLIQGESVCQKTAAELGPTIQCSLGGSHVTTSPGSTTTYLYCELCSVVPVQHTCICASQQTGTYGCPLQASFRPTSDGVRGDWTPARPSARDHWCCIRPRFQFWVFKFIGT